MSEFDIAEPALEDDSEDWDKPVPISEAGMGSRYLRQGRAHRVPLESVKAWKYVETLFTMNPGMEIGIKRVGNFLELRRIDENEAVQQPASD